MINNRIEIIFEGPNQIKLETLTESLDCISSIFESIVDEVILEDKSLYQNKLPFESESLCANDLFELNVISLEKGCISVVIEICLKKFLYKFLEKVLLEEVIEMIIEKAYKTLSEIFGEVSESIITNNPISIIRDLKLHQFINGEQYNLVKKLFMSVIIDPYITGLKIKINDYYSKTKDSETILNLNRKELIAYNLLNDGDRDIVNGFIQSENLSEWKECSFSILAENKIISVKFLDTEFINEVNQGEIYLTNYTLLKVKMTTKYSEGELKYFITKVLNKDGLKKRIY
jgi:hypothetical protein